MFSFNSYKIKFLDYAFIFGINESIFPVLQDKKVFFNVNMPFCYDRKEKKMADVSFYLYYMNAHNIWTYIYIGKG